MFWVLSVSSVTPRVIGRDSNREYALQLAGALSPVSVQRCQSPFNYATFQILSNNALEKNILKECRAGMHYNLKHSVRASSLVFLLLSNYSQGYYSRALQAISLAGIGFFARI
jgi:hypothetical protein